MLRLALNIPQLFISAVLLPFARIYTTFLIHVPVLSPAAVCVYYRRQLDGEQVANPRGGCVVCDGNYTDFL